jgi:hypothetical protein
MINKKIFLLLILFTVSLLKSASAKENDLTTWIDLAALKKIHSATFGLTGEFRTMQNNSIVERYGLGVKVDYAFFPWLSAGVGYVISKYKIPDSYERRDRYYFQVEPSFQISKLQFGFRERIQVTQYPESPIYLPPSNLWRNRLETCYKHINWKVDPLISFESLYLLGDVNHRKLTETRYSVGAYYHITAHHKIKFYGMLTENSILSRFVLGVNYEFKL